MSDLRENVARALSEGGQAASWENALEGADAAIAIVLEHAAKVAESPSHPGDWTMDQTTAAMAWGNALAAEYRRMASEQA